MSVFLHVCIMRVRDAIALFIKERDVRGTSPFVIRAYNKVLSQLRGLDPNEALTPRKINGLVITQHMKTKLAHIIKMTPEKTALRQRLMDVLGIGEKKADELINAGLSNPRQLQSKKWQDQLPESAVLMIKYKPLRRIPHAMIAESHTLTDFKGKVVIVGGFRRGKAYSKDIDVLVEKKRMKAYVDMLTDKLNGIVYSMGDDKASLLVNIGAWVKVDVFGATPPEWVPMLTYGTGSKQFNIRMRAKAKNMGFLLNQSGLFDRKNMTRVPIKSERDLFRRLNIEWVDPTKR